MKKWVMMGVVLCVAFMMAAPALAVEGNFTGSIRSRGFVDTNVTLDDDDSSSSYMNMRLRMAGDFIVTDNLSFTTRFDALDNKRWGDADLPDNNIDWDRAFMTIKGGDLGTLQVGRMGGGTWGTLFNDTDSERDRVKYTKKFECFTLLAIYEKNAEGDEGVDVNDSDHDIYYLAGYYEVEDWTLGLLYGYQRNMAASDTPIGTEDRIHNFIPYFFGKIGGLSLQGELRWNVGEREQDIGDDRDISRMAWNVEGAYDFGICKLELGYAWTAGQEEDEEDLEGYATGFGDDWEKLWILTGTEVDLVIDDLGGYGNLSNVPFDAGAAIAYGGVHFPILENLNLSFIVGYAMANEEPEGFDDEYGWEYDLVATWKIFDNLTYTALAAYLDAGDFWQGTTDRDLENNLALFHELQLSF
jgi:predicted porin